MAEIDKEAFIAAVVHDLRAPLNACLMSLSLLELKASQPEEVLKTADVIRRNLDRQAQLIHDLGDILQIAGDGIELDVAPLDACALLEDVVEKHGQSAGETGVGVRWAGSPGACPVEADGERLAQAFRIVLETLSQAAGSSDCIDVAAERDGDSLRVNAALAAGPAADGDDERRRRRSAVQVAIAEHLVERHGGALETDSDGAPAGFTIRLPLRSAA